MVNAGSAFCGAPEIRLAYWAVERSGGSRSGNALAINHLASQLKPMISYFTPRTR